MKLDALTIKQLIMDHYEFPRNFKKNIDSASYKMKHLATDSCIDDIKVFAKFEKNKLQDLVFDGRACTISTASTSMMTELVKGKTIKEIQQLIENYEKMIALENFDANLLGESVVFSEVGKQANRISCATIGWRALKQLLEDYIKENPNHV